MVDFVGLYNYWIVIFLAMAGLYIVIARGNLIKKLVGLNVFQASVFILYISFGKVTGAPRRSWPRVSRSIQIPCPMC